MDDFGAPSFSLGIDELHESFNQATPCVPSASPVCSDVQVPTTSNGLHPVTPKPSCGLHPATPKPSCSDYDSDFEAAPQSTSRVLKRLKRRQSSGEASTVPVHAKQIQPSCNPNVNGKKPTGLEGFWKNLAVKKSATHEEAPGGNNSGAALISQGQWRTPGGRIASGFSARSSGDPNQGGSSNETVFLQEGPSAGLNRNELDFSQCIRVNSNEEAATRCKDATFSSCADEKGAHLPNNYPSADNCQSKLKTFMTVSDEEKPNVPEESILCNSQSRQCTSMNGNRNLHITDSNLPQKGPETLISPSKSTVQNSGVSLDVKSAALLEKCPLKKGKANKLTALNSFWRSLNDKKLNTSQAPVAVHGDVEEDAIEEYSSDEFQPLDVSSSQSARKLSLCHNAAVSRSFAAQPGFPAVVQRFDHCSSVCALKFSSSDRAAQCVDGSSFDKPYDLCMNDDTLFDLDDCNVVPPNKVGSYGAGPKQISDAFPSAKDMPEDVCGAFFGCKRTNNPKMTSLLHQRFPHFTPVCALQQGAFSGSEQVYIDYENQFNAGESVSGSSAFHIHKKQAQQVITKSSQVSRKGRKTAIADNDGWIRPSKNMPAKRKKANKHWVQPGSKNPAITTQKGDGESTPGHWVTEKTGKRIYITQDGRKLSGSMAYRQHMKDSGRRSKKTKVRRPRKRK